ncbi:MAG: futalosine hydrolase [Chitinophagaceae bacterium]
MKIIITSATEFETEEAKKKIKSTKKIDISFSVTGIGMLATAVNLTKIIYEQKPDLMIQAGIAGCFDEDIELGKVVLIEKEFLGDLGVEENSKWIDVFDLKLIEASQKPFNKKAIINKRIKQYNWGNLPIVNAVTVNQITTQPQHINQLIKKYKPTIESMEGAALHYVCNSFNIPYLQIRSISNYIGERDKTKWKMKLAINNLNKGIREVIKLLN